MKISRFVGLCIWVMALVITGLPQTGDSSLFAVPPLLKDNVAFWTLVYTGLSLNEGVLHDRDYPLVIYRKLDIRDRNSFTKSRYIESEKSALVKDLEDLNQRPDSLWTREEKEIDSLLKAHAPANALAGAEDRIRFQQGQKERFREGLERSTAFVDTIRAIFVAHGIPPDLAYLPHVESSFNTEAYSKVGAAGLWQFMRGTGRLFLKINYLIDQRRDPVVATVAAARLLKQNYDQLQSWPLAITAYNHGVNGMKRAVEMVGTRDISAIIANYSSPSFQFASKNFYACFLAARQIAMHPEAYFTDLHFAPKYEFKSVTLPSFMRPSVVCKYLTISQKTLMDYNPALRPVVFYQQKLIPSGFEIRIPAAIKLPEAEKVLAAVPDSLKSDAPDRSQYYSVQRGDNLYTIAERLGVPLSRLTQENNITRSERIYAGQVLRVPQGAPVTQLAQAQPETTSVAETSVPDAPVSPPADSVSPPAKISPKLKTAMPRAAAVDTTGTRAAGVPSPEEAISDSLKDAALAKADTLPDYSRNGKPDVIPEFDVLNYNLETTLSPAGDVAKIEVSVDETIGHYADWLGIPTYRIRRLNRLGARSEIRIGGTVSIPVAPDQLDRFVKARLEYHMALEEDFYTRYKVADVQARVVKRGETLWNICNDDDQIPLWLFAKYNKNADLSKLMPGTRVWIPVVEEKTERDIALENGQAIGVYPVFEEPIKKGVSGQVRRMP